MRSFWIIAACIFAAVIDTTIAFHIPQLNPKGYKKGTKLTINAGQLFSPRTTMPFDFYKLQWCPSIEGHEYDPSSVGVSMRDTLMVASPFEYIFGQDK
jgi:hypothetical protein